MLCGGCVLFRNSAGFLFKPRAKSSWQGQPVAVKQGIGLDGDYKCCCLVMVTVLEHSSEAFVLRDMTKSGSRIIVPSDADTPLVWLSGRKGVFPQTRDISEWKLDFIELQLKNIEARLRKREQRKRRLTEPEHEPEHDHEPDATPGKKQKIRIKIARSNKFMHRASVSMAPHYAAPSTAWRRVLPDCQCINIMDRLGLPDWTREPSVTSAQGPQRMYCHRNLVPLAEGTRCCCFRNGQSFGWVVRNGADAMFVPESKQVTLMSAKHDDVYRHDLLPEEAVLRCIHPPTKINRVLEMLDSMPDSYDLLRQTIGTQDVVFLEPRAAPTMTVEEFVSILTANDMKALIPQASLNLYRAVCVLGKRFDLAVLAKVLRSEKIDCSEGCFQSLSEEDVLFGLNRGISSCTLLKFHQTCKTRRKLMHAAIETTREQDEDLMMCRQQSGINFPLCKSTTTQSGQVWLTNELSKHLAPINTQLEMKVQLESLRSDHHRLLAAKETELKAIPDLGRFVVEMRLCGPEFWNSFRGRIAGYVKRKPTPLDSFDVRRELTALMIETLTTFVKKSECANCKQEGSIMRRPCNMGSCRFLVCSTCVCNSDKPFECADCEMSSISCVGGCETKIEVENCVVRCTACQVVYWHPEPAEVPKSGGKQWEEARSLEEVDYEESSSDSSGSDDDE